MSVIVEGGMVDVTDECGDAIRLNLGIIDRKRVVGVCHYEDGQEGDEVIISREDWAVLRQALDQWFNKGDVPLHLGHGFANCGLESCRVNTGKGGDSYCDQCQRAIDRA